VPQPGEVKASDTCGRCGLRRATRELEEQGVQIRLCDDCYWGQEPAEGSRPTVPPTAA
jgi:hypothetical protein